MWIEAPADVFSVSEITGEIKELLEIQLPSIWVEGEVSNFTRHTSGHLYFSLKDEDAQLSCVMWKPRAAALFMTPRDGLKVRAFGSIRVYEKRGTYQLDVMRMMPAGIGELQAAFEALKQKLLQEGLFDPAHKKPLPLFPQNIGIISSATGAAVRDIVHVLNRRMPCVKKILRPTLVQGEGAAQDIADAITELNEYGQLELIILARGGGSLEDLWAFNEEIVARAVYASRVPIISAIGHEIDFTISDFVADLRAPTPSAAAELAVRSSDEVSSVLKNAMHRAENALGRKIDDLHVMLHQLQSSYAFRRPADMVLQRRQRLDELMRTVKVAAANKLSISQHSADQLHKRLRALHPESILQRGYALVWDKETQRFVRTSNQVVERQSIEILLSEGGLEATITQKNEETTLPHIFKVQSE